MRVTVCAIAVLLPLAAAAGQWHTGESLMCQDCHLQHSSEQGEPVAGGPYSVLLLKSSINELCLSCHDGSNPTAPDVQSPVQMYQGTPSGESAGGWFGLLGA
ncbi:MAG TPA: cytochrome c3 family protein, partial [candidate division Zixibacteria bacterium]|nr:cytochrome c3 family protein [candidate division Zixibacteria bacterium]